MPIKTLKQLSPRDRSMWESIYKEIKGKYGEERATKIAWTIVRKRMMNPSRDGKKSLVVEQNQHSTGNSKLEGNYVDVMLGLPTIDADNEHLTDNFWGNRPNGVLKGDMEHYYADKAEGLYVEEAEYEGWIPIAQRFWHDDEGALYARAELPENHPFTPTFIEEWKSGKYGVSIEYTYPDEAVEYEWTEGSLIKKVTEGAITGFTFTENPAIKQTKNGK